MKSPLDRRDYVYTQEEATLKTFDMRPNLLPVRDQGEQGSCFAMSTACMKEYQEERDYGLDEYLSPQFFYDQRFNRYDERADNDEGMYGRNVMKLLAKVGICTEAEYPYGVPILRTDVPPHIYESASKHKVAGYAAVRTLNALKKSLVFNGPCLIGFPVYNYGGRMWRPEFEGQPMKGGHAMAVVGYTEDSFIIRNSWGGNWGDGGYCYYPFEDWGAHWELWTTIDADTVVEVEDVADEVDEAEVDEAEDVTDEVVEDVADEVVEDVADEADEDVEDEDVEDVETDEADEVVIDEAESDVEDEDGKIEAPKRRNWCMALACVLCGYFSYICFNRQRR